MAGSDWFFPVTMVRDLFESGYTGTVFAGPVGTVYALPGALGGDMRQWPELQAKVNLSTHSFFQLLHAKAHYLMLPKSIIAAMNTGPVDFSEDNPGKGNQGVTIWDPTFNRVEMSIPGARTAVVRAGYGLGRNVPFSEDLGGYYQKLGLIYHEMTHAWLDLHERDNEMQKLWADGRAAYEGAVGVADQHFEADYAFSEAAASYVEDRIGRWCKALQRLDGLLLRIRPATPDELDSIEFDFNSPVTPVVMLQNDQGNEEELSTPTLSDTLHEALNKKVLEGLPLTQTFFKDTPLAALRDKLRTG
jgi:hypothetical protein